MVGRSRIFPQVRYGVTIIARRDEKRVVVRFVTRASCALPSPSSPDRATISSMNQPGRDSATAAVSPDNPQQLELDWQRREQGASQLVCGECHIGWRMVCGSREAPVIG